MSARKTLREIERGLPMGYGVKPYNTGKHPHVVVAPDGKPLRGRDGKPIHVSATPSDHRHILNLLSRVRRAVREGGQ